MKTQVNNRLQIDGKFFLLDGERIFLRCVTYGPFPQPKPDVFKEFFEIAQAGFNVVRIYEPPSEAMLEAALKNNMLLFVGVPWQSHRVFLGDGSDTFWHEARVSFLRELQIWGTHPCVAAVYIANEISPDIARWQGYVETRQALDGLIIDIRSKYPHLLYAYSSYPSSEYLEPALADFTAINVYLEDKNKLTSYLRHVHHVAGDRPVLISEFGFDSYRNGEARQAEVLAWQLYIMRETGMAGATLFSWSDKWSRGGFEVEDWSFGLLDRGGRKKAAFEVVNKVLPLPRLSRYPMMSVIICVHNGASRIRPCLEALSHLNYPSYEVIIVDDGSKDHIQEVVSDFPQYHFLRQKHSGLSEARNFGARMAKGGIFAYTDDDCMPDQDWLYWLAKAYDELDCDLCGGPNLAPEPFDEDEAIVAAGPGAPTHVMLSDTEAEHIPGCNLSVKREAFELIGGFNTDYWVAGDDVDFCWRAEDLNLKIGFHGAAFVWHRRRATYWKYFKQQRGYGYAEILLMERHPERFNEFSEARWKGVVYAGGAVSALQNDTIYAGAMGQGAYQRVIANVMPTRPLHRKFMSPRAIRKLKFAEWLQPLVRAFTRMYYSGVSNIFGYSQLIYRLIFDRKPSGKGEKYTISEYGLESDTWEIKGTFLNDKKDEGWRICDDNDHWELENHEGCKLLTCLETLGGGLWVLKVRESKPNS